MIWKKEDMSHVEHITGHRLYVAGVAGESLGPVRRQQETDDRRQRTDAEQDTAATVQDARDLPRVGRQAGQVELTAVDATQLLRCRRHHTRRPIGQTRAQPFYGLPA